MYDSVCMYISYDHNYNCTEYSEPDNMNEIWSENEEEISADLETETELPDLRSNSSKSYILSSWLVHFFVVMQAMFRLSDMVIAYFLKFFHIFFKVLGRESSIANEIARYLPPSLYIARKAYDNFKFRRYVVCRKCHSLYYLSDCIEGVSQKQSKVCCFRKYPSHPHASMRKQCGSLLLKTVEMSNGNRHFYPFMTYCYIGLEASLCSFLSRSNFLIKCEEWRNRKLEQGILRDVYDGDIWKQLMVYNGQPFLSEEGNLAFILNMDFFQPYKHVQYSLGAIYLTILNLPRDIWYKQENTILVGLIPGPSEPKHDINSYMNPLVEELLKLWSGIEFNVAGAGKKKIRCALLCIACDLPAGRKVCGFLGRGARLGCSRCLKEFPGSVGTMDYSGFDRGNWELRNGTEHTKASLELLSINTSSALRKAESDHGCRYSVLMKLPYFDAPRMLIIGPMHNLFLGSAKHFLKGLIQRDLISESQFDLIQNRIDNFVVPSDTGRIPHKIRSGFSSFTADQWKNWTVYFSLIALRDILPSEEFECWRHFVLACRLLSCKVLSTQQMQLGDALLLQFCRRTQRLFGQDFITPNMHMHCHLRACIIDYGPLHGFCLYAFERYNGILGSMPTNNRSIEIQLMARFIRESQVLSASLPELFRDDFSPLFPETKVSGSVSDTSSAVDAALALSPDSAYELPLYDNISFIKHFYAVYLHCYEWKTAWNLL